VILRWTKYVKYFRNAQGDLLVVFIKIDAHSHFSDCCKTVMTAFLIGIWAFELLGLLVTLISHLLGTMTWIYWQRRRTVTKRPT
jgi:hypothetical protein